jgi:hypothetical protein
MSFAAPEATSTTIGIISGATRATQTQTNRVPLTIPTEQEYYWRYRWQNEERQCLLEVNSGEALTFDSDDPEDVARWLLEADDE